MQPCSGGKVKLQDPISENEYFIDPNDPSLYSNIEEAKKSIDLELSRTPKEAIAILLDISGSMGEEYFNHAFKRIEIAKELFTAFANRTIGYNLHHVVSLVLFNNKVINSRRIH